MGNIENQLKQIIENQLDVCKKDNTVPSKELLDTIQVLNIIYHSC